MDDMPPALWSVLRKARVKKFPRGQIILYEGDIPTEVLVIKSGTVKIYDIDESGNEKILHIVRKPTLIPFAFFSGETSPMRWFYAALTDCEVFVLRVEETHKTMAADSKFADALVNDFSTDVHELLVRLSSMSKSTVQDKLFAALRFLITCHASERRGGWWRVEFPINHQLLADLSGVTRESIAVAMKDLQDQKFVRSPRLNILEINSEKLSHM